MYFQLMLKTSLDFQVALNLGETVPLSRGKAKKSAFRRAIELRPMVLESCVSRVR